MALTLSKYGAVSDIRLYCDVIQYARAIGYVKNIYNEGCTPMIDSEATPFEYNCAKSETYVTDPSNPVNRLSFNCEFKSIDEGEKNFAWLLKHINYFALYGHNLATASPN